MVSVEDTTVIYEHEVVRSLMSVEDTAVISEHEVLSAMGAQQ